MLVRFLNISNKIREIVSIIASKFYKLKPKNIIAVTGTNGKTSIVFFLYNFLSSLGIKVGMLSTIENSILDKKVKSKLTTPSPVQLHELLDNMIKSSCEYCVMEASSHSIDQKRIMGKDIFIGIFSNLSHDHLDYHKTFINYINTKKKLFDDLPKTSYSIINSDDKRSEYLVQNTKSKVLSYGLKKISDSKGKIVESGTNGIKIKIDNVNVHFKIIGDFNAYNLLSVFAVGKVLKIEEDGRMFPESDSSQTIIDCFLLATQKLKIDILTLHSVQSLFQKEEGWKIETNSDTFFENNQ